MLRWRCCCCAARSHVHRLPALPLSQRLLTKLPCLPFSSSSGVLLQLGHGHFHDEGLLMLVDNIRNERIVSVAAGRAHSVALAADGKIFTWGDASKGQLGHAQLAAVMQVGWLAYGCCIFCCSRCFQIGLLGLQCPTILPPSRHSLPAPASPPLPACRAPTRSRCPSLSPRPSSLWNRPA